MNIEALLILNSLLVGICLYFVRDFHRDFKSMNSTVQSLKEKFTELSTKVNIQIKAIMTRISRIDKIEEDNK